jgi:plasmid stability protein
VTTRNITLNLPADLIRKAKVYAAEHETSVNNLVKDLLDHKVNELSRSREAAKRLLALADAGPYSTVDPSTIKREEIYERR